MNEVIQGGVEIDNNTEKYNEMEKWANTCKVWKKWIKPTLKNTGDLIRVDFKTGQILERSTIVDTNYSFNYQVNDDFKGKAAVIKEIDGIYTLFFDNMDYNEKGQVFLEFKSIDSENNEWMIRGLLCPFKFTFKMQNGMTISKESLIEFLNEIGLKENGL